MQLLRYSVLLVGIAFGLQAFLFAPAPAVGQAKDDDVRAMLMPWLEREIKAKNIPSVSIAIVDDQRVVFSASVGAAD